MVLPSRLLLTSSWRILRAYTGRITFVYRNTRVVLRRFDQIHGYLQSGALYTGFNTAPPPSLSRTTNRKRIAGEQREGQDCLFVSIARLQTWRFVYFRSTYRRDYRSRTTAVSIWIFHPLIHIFNQKRTISNFSYSFLLRGGFTDPSFTVYSSCADAIHRRADVLKKEPIWRIE